MLLIEYLASYQKKLLIEKNVSPHTLNAYEKDILSFCKFLHENTIYTISEISAVTISLWIESLSRTDLAPRSISRKLSALKSFFHYLYKEKIIENNTTLLFRNPKVKKHIPMILNNKEMMVYLEQIPKNTILERRNYCILLLLYTTAIRSEELCSLRINDIYQHQKIIRILGKGKKERLVPMIPIIEKELKQWIQERKTLDKENHPNLFLSQRGKPLTTAMIRKIIGQTSTINGKKMHPHAFRYTCGSHLLSNGANLREIQELLGHSSISTTEKYTHLNIENIKTSYKKFHPHG